MINDIRLYVTEDGEAVLQIQRDPGGEWVQIPMVSSSVYDRKLDSLKSSSLSRKIADSLGK